MTSWLRDNYMEHYLMYNEGNSVVVKDLLEI